MVELHLRVGDTVTLRAKRYDRAGYGYPNDFALDDRHTLRVTRVTGNSITARGTFRGAEASVRFYRDDIERLNGSALTSEQTGLPRKLGEKPADTDDMTYIPLDAPGIQWLFKDMGAYADERGWCSTYDELATDLGIPSRGEEFEVEMTRNGIDFTITVRGLNREDATEKARALVIPV